MIEANCPSCGGPIRFTCKVSLYAVCGYCRSLVLRKDLDVEKVGEVAELADDGTPLQIGATGRYRGRPFGVVGRLQLRFPQGYWNEWHLDLSADRPAWLGESQGVYAVTLLTEPTLPVPRFEDLEVGGAVALNGEEFTVKDLQAATCVSGEGELPFLFQGGYQAPLADLAGAGKRFATLDYSENPPLLFLGERCEFEDLELRGLRKFEGW